VSAKLDRAYAAHCLVSAKLDRAYTAHFLVSAKLDRAYTAHFLVSAKTNCFCLASKFICYSCSGGDVKKCVCVCVCLGRNLLLTSIQEVLHSAVLNSTKYNLPFHNGKKETAALRVTVNI